jgi:ATP-dependent Clp protease ATP-binding subunit ClpC
MDAGNMLKPMLARGELHCIGATTLDEYREYIEKDKALERRFQPVQINEPTEEDTISILRGLKEKYERFHGVSLTSDALDYAVRLSVRYIGDRFLPDKAIDLIDEAAARKRMQGGSLVNGEDVAAAAGEKTGIPLNSLTGGETERHRRLESDMKKRILGQDAAVEAVCSGVRRAKTGVRDQEKPACSFLFIGKSGVGKTECAKVLAELLYGKDAFLRLDMTEYAEAHSLSKFIGAPPGYAGFGEGGFLTERVRRRPYSLVLFDEVEKAHPEVRGLLLQILDEGKLTDAAGLTVSFRNTTVVMTAGLGEGAAGIGFAAVPGEEGKKRAEALLSAELTDRVDEIAYFRPLDKDTLAQVALGRMRALTERLKEQGIAVSVDPSFLALAMQQSEGGARAVCRHVAKAAEELLAGGILDGTLEKDRDILLCGENGAFRMKISEKSY